jgi:hypothetical protein
MKILLMMVVVQFLTMVVFAWFNRVVWIRILALRQQLAVYKRKSKKPVLREDPIQLSNPMDPGTRSSGPRLVSISQARRDADSSREVSDSSNWPTLRRGLSIRTRSDDNYAASR